jgi:hypothetical protein
VSQYPSLRPKPHRFVCGSNGAIVGKFIFWIIDFLWKEVQKTGKILLHGMVVKYFYD